MKRALAAAAVAGAALGLVTPALYGLTASSYLLFAEGLFLASAWLFGRLAADLRTGAACGVAFVVAYNLGLELMPWTGIENDVVEYTGDPALGRQIRDAFDHGVGIDWRTGPAAIAMAAAAGTRHRAAWALLAGALIADVTLPLPDFVSGWGLTLVAAAAAGVYVAVRCAKPRWTLVLIMLPIAVVNIGDRLLGSNVVGGTHPEISVIR